ncbi:MAG: hypothetical protein FWE90_13580 [Defluviitaleaceae bacterium]|nr:hypothetical protein [Defluviitaleaceae bacterium]
MKRRKSIATLVIAVVLVGIVSFPYLRTVVSAQPGEANDPLVTRRYVDERVDALWTEIQTLRTENALLRDMVEAGGLPGFPGGPIDMQAMTAAVFADVILSFEFIYGEMLRAASEACDCAEQGERSLAWDVINPQRNQTLIIENGTEVILRSGSAVVVAGPNGLVNMTTGGDILDGQNVGLNNLLIAPRTDGRGIRITSNSAWVMVRGAYTLE